MCCHLSDYVVLGEAMSTSAKIMGIRFNSLFLSVRRKPLSLKKLATEAANKIIEQKSSGKINLIIGINRDGSLAGVRVLSHNETPGLGDKVDLKKSQWILGFNGKSLQNPTENLWTVKKDGGEFDQFTGATITPRAVVQQVRRTLEFFRASHTTLLNDSVQPEANSSEVK